jgi:hypothetical protein
VNIEHGQRNRILDNDFRDNACGVHLWWDPDEGLTKLPWSQANGHACEENVLHGNRFERDALAVQIRECPGTLLAVNTMQEVGRAIDATPGSEPREGELGEPSWELPDYPVLGDTRPVGARAQLRGREHIVTTEWGPYDWQGPHLQRVADRADGSHVYRLLGTQEVLGTEIGEPARVSVEPGTPPQLVVSVDEPGRIVPYVLSVESAEGLLERRGVLVGATWKVGFFPTEADPTEDPRSWLRACIGAISAGDGFQTGSLDLRFGSGGPSQLPGIGKELLDADLPRDHFGTRAESEPVVPAGKWRIRTLSDDGIRVLVDGELLIDDWTWHPPRAHEAVFELERTRPVPIQVNHFELDGHAVLRLEIEPVLE